ncbi:MAG: lysylphosphatidylglycerol synthase domain-containing protein [Desulfobacteraceae bacterium]|jgi:uncharacterized membrane protein YbhN (UPF0104 family)|nr:lysylphosphatidylglycerol synthase domain-containing protein [Desulfobacteraceae bacterium]
MISPIRNHWSQLKPVIQALVSIFCLLWVIYIIRGIDWQASQAVFVNISYVHFVACLFVMGGLYASKMCRLIGLVNIVAPGRLTLKEWVGKYLKSIAFGSLTPARIGDFSRISMLGSKNIHLTIRSYVVFYDKFQDLLYIPLVMCVTAPIVNNKLGVPIGLLITLGVFLLLGFIGASYGMGRFLGIKTVFFGWGITIVGLLLFVAGNSLLFKSIDVDLNVMDIAAVTIIVGIVANLPISLGGIGLREGSFLFILNRWGVEPSLIPPVLILEFVLNILYPVSLYALWRGYSYFYPIKI